MNEIPIISYNDELIRQVSAVVRSSGVRGYLPIKITGLEQALDVLTFDMPILTIVDFTDEEIYIPLMEAIADDPWLMQSSIIAICADFDSLRRLESLKNSSLIYALRVPEIPFKLAKVFSIVTENQRILFQKGLGYELVPNISAKFSLSNDALEAACYINLVCNALFCSSLVNLSGKRKLQLALHELLTNAIEHGNCNISFEDKTAWLESGGSMEELIKQRLTDDAVAARKITFEFYTGKSQADFIITDQGSGFNWESVLNANASRLSDAELPEISDIRLHGRGLSITKAIVYDLQFNQRGNQVSFSFPFSGEKLGMLPAMFRELPIRTFQEGDIVFSQGEWGNFMYYIVSGLYDVYVSNKLVTTLSAEDVLVGEMSFLLSNVRNATVRCRESGKLVGIAKKQFVHIVRKHPQYALLFSRLLALRIERLNKNLLQYL